MKQRRLAVMALAASVAAFPSSQAAADMLTLCGVLDQTPGVDLDARPGFVRVVCLLPAGGTFDGTAEEMVTPTFDQIRLSGTYTGMDTLTVSNAYNFLQSGAGFEESTFSGRLQNLPGVQGPTSGGELVNQSAAASTFSGPAALATWAGPPAGTSFGLLGSLPVEGSQRLVGQYVAGPGVLTGTIAFNAGAQQQLSFAASEEFTAAVPEPAILSLIGGGLVMLAGARLRRTTSKR